MRRGHFLALLVLSFTLVSCGAFSEAVPRELFSSRVAVDEKGAEYVEGEVLVQLSHGASTMSAQGFAASRGMTAARRFEALSSAKGKDVMHLRSDSKSTARMIQELSADPRVEIVEPNYIRRASETLPNDPRFGELWGLRNTGQSSGTAGRTLMPQMPGTLRRTPLKQLLRCSTRVFTILMRILRPTCGTVLRSASRITAGTASTATIIRTICKATVPTARGR